MENTLKKDKEMIYKIETLNKTGGPNKMFETYADNCEVRWTKNLNDKDCWALLIESETYLYKVIIDLPDIIKVNECRQPVETDEKICSMIEQLVGDKYVKYLKSA